MNTPPMVLLTMATMLAMYNSRCRLEVSEPVATPMLAITPAGSSWPLRGNHGQSDLGQPRPNGWGAGEPAVIPPGPGNPLGTRALALSASGILIHGSPANWSIGSYASHGCIRMFLSDAEDLFSRVPAGAPVLIHGGGPASTPTSQAAGA